jgi:hypothetical protein
VGREGRLQKNTAAASFYRADKMPYRDVSIVVFTRSLRGFLLEI